jgi:hypothetical protein
MQRVYRQVCSKRSIAENEFSRGLIDFDFSIGGQTVWIPNRSYFRLGLKIVNKTTPAQHVALADEVTFANYCPGNLFDNCFFMAGGQNVSSITNYSAQAHAAAYRLKKSGAWLNTIGKDAYGINPSYEYRQNQTASDGSWMVDSGSFDAGNVPQPDERAMGSVFMMYAPPLGIMEHGKPMASGDYRFQFNPASNFETAGLESTGGVNNFKLVVESMELYICTEKQEVAASGTEVLHLMEHQIQSKPLGGLGEKNFDFTVPSSTKAISIFVQSGNAGSSTLMPPSKFCCADDQERTLKSVQITYANITKPPTRWSSKYSQAERKLQQRYLDTQIESSQAFSPGGAQTLQQWMNDGVLLHYSWIRDANDRSTQLQLQVDYDLAEANSNIFLIAHYTKSVEIQVSNGFVSSVTSLVV